MIWCFREVKNMLLRHVGNEQNLGFVMQFFNHWIFKYTLWHIRLLTSENDLLSTLSLINKEINLMLVIALRSKSQLNSIILTCIIHAANWSTCKKKKMIKSKEDRYFDMAKSLVFRCTTLDILAGFI
jgi:hypothetical protein